MQALTHTQSVFRRRSFRASLLGVALLLPAGFLSSAQASSYASSSASATAISYSSGGYGTSSNKCCCCQSDVLDKAINKLIQGHAVVSVILVNGVRVQGIIKAADCKIIILECDGICRIIYKHAIAEIIPTSTVLSY